MIFFESLEAAKLDSSFIFDSQRGFNMAAAFTSYDGSEEPELLDASFGQIVFNLKKWGPLQTGGYGSEKIRILSHTCTDEELGLLDAQDLDKSKFMPVINESARQVLSSYRKKFQCVDDVNSL